MNEDYGWIPATIMGVTGIVAAIAGAVRLHANNEKAKTDRAQIAADRDVAVSKENSVGAVALDRITRKIDNLEKQMEEAREDIKENQREYLNTLKELASKLGR